MDANLQSDFTTINGFLEKLLQMIEAAGTNDARSKLAEALLSHYKLRHTLEFRTIPAKYAKEVTETLERYGVPHMASKNSAGDTVLILPPEQECHVKYEKYMNEVFMHYPEYYKQLSAPTWTRLARMDGEKEVISFHFSNRLDAEIFKNKIYADGNGTVTTDKINFKDGSVTVYCRQSDFINSRRGVDAVSAFIDTEYSLDRHNQAFARRLAVWHDSNQADECMRLMAADKSFVIHDGANKYADHLLYDNGTLTYNHYDSETKKFLTKTVDVTREDKDAMRKLFEYQVAHIHNEHVSTVEEFEQGFANHTESFIRDAYVDKQKDMYTKVIMPVMEFVSSTGNDLCDQELFEQIVHSDMFTQRIKENHLEDIRPDFSIDFLESLRSDFTAQRASLEADLSELIKNAKQEYEQFETMLTDRASSLKRSMIGSGMHTIGGCSVADMTIPALQQELTHKVRRQEAKLYEACGFDTKLSGDPVSLLRPFYNRGIPIAHAHIAVPLLAKKELSPDEKETLRQIADDTLFDICAKENQGIALLVKDYHATRAALREVDDLLSDCSRLSEEREADHVKNMELIKKQRKLVDSADRQIANMDTLIRSEKQRVVDMEKMDKDIHLHIQKFREHNPAAGMEAVLQEVRQFLKDEGITDIHASATSQSFEAFETEMNEADRVWEQATRAFEDAERSA